MAKVLDPSPKPWPYEIGNPSLNPNPIDKKLYFLSWSLPWDWIFFQ